MNMVFTPTPVLARIRSGALLAGCAMGSLCLAGAANAQQAATPSSTAVAPSLTTDDIVVTAQRTGAQALQKTPIAIAAFSQQQLQDRQVSNIKDLMQFTPNLQVSQQSANALIYIRGVGTSNNYAGSDPDVTTQVDGVYIARPSAQLGDFFDVERVEILRGPQGTLYGRNAAGGTINVISRKPTDHFASQVALTGGTFGLFQAQGYVSGPIVPGTLQVSLSGNYMRHDGYIENIAPGGHDIDSANRGSVRGQIRFESGSFESITRGDYYKTHEYIESYDQLLAPQLKPVAAPLANSTIGDYTKVALNDPQLLKAHGGGASEEINIGLTDTLKLKSLTAYRESHYRVTNDSDATELNLTVNHQAEDQKQFSEELDLNYNKGPIAAVAGAYYFRERIIGLTLVDIMATHVEPGSIPDVVDHSKAVFAQGSYTIIPGLRATIGGRYTWEDKSIDPYAYTKSLVTGALLGPVFTTPDHNNYHAFTPKFGLDYQINPNFLIYASVTRGFKSGGFNYSARSTAAIEFNPEKIWSYEAGIKSDWLDHHLRLNLTAFKYDYKGLQVQSILSPGNVFIGNAAKANIKGLEAEIQIKPVQGLTLSSNASYLDARYGNFNNASVVTGALPYVVNDPRYNPATTTFNASGNRLNEAPKFSTFQAIQYDLPVSFGTITARAEYSWQSRTFYDATNIDILSQKSYGLVNLALGWRSKDGAWHAQVLARNVGDKHYLNSAAAPGNLPTGHAGAPRTIAFTLARTF